VVIIVLVWNDPATILDEAELLQFLTNSELAAGNLTGAKQLAAENQLNPTYQMRISYYEGDWKAATGALEEALKSARSVGAVWLELGSLSYGVDLLRVIGDYPGAAAALERALSLYRPEDLYWEARIRSQGVLLCFDAGQPGKATEHLHSCGKILAGKKDWLGQAGHLWRAEALGAAFQERFEDSDRYFERSTEIFKQYSLPWYEAETLQYWGKTLLQAGQLHRAREKFDKAIKVYRDHGGGQPWIDRVDADRRRAEPPLAQSRPQSVDASGENARQEAVFRDEGDFWTISYQTHRFRLRDVRGLHYIAYLLAHPNEHFHVRELSATQGGEAFPTIS
jgi:tetratricopeptide (TPR) repeat protein